MVKTRNLSEVSIENARMVRATIFLSRDIERSMISQLTGLTFPVVTKNVNMMLASGFLSNQSQTGTRKGSGRVPSRLSVNPDYGWAIGIEIGPYRITAAISDASGVIKENHIIVDFIPLEYDSLIGALSSFIEKKIELKKTLPIGIGISTPGGNIKDGGAFYRYDRPDWNGKNIEKELSDKYNVPVLIMNNVTSMALYFNLTSNLEDGNFSFFFASKGIAVVEFKHQRNYIYSSVEHSGQVGHMVLDINGDICPGCGKKGCLESTSSEFVILEKCRKRLEEIGEDTQGLTIEKIIERRKQDPSFMEDIFKKAIDYMAIAISNIQNYSPVKKMFIMSRIITSDVEFDSLVDRIKENLYLPYSNPTEFIRLEYSPYFGANAAAFCLLYDRYVGIGSRLL